jgi:MFS family permease
VSETHDPYSALRVPLYRRYLIISYFVNIGTAGQGLAIGWEMYDRTGQALALGMVGLVQAVPMLLFTLPAGYLADVFDRRKLMMLSLAGATLTSIALAACSWYQAPVFWMYGILFLDSVLVRLGWPARSAILPLLVPTSIFENAIKWRTIFQQITGIIGPVVGGIIIAFNIQAAYLLSALSSAVFILFLYGMALPDAPRSPRGNMFGQVAEGLRFVWRTKLVLGASSLDMFAVLLGGAVYLLPVFAADIIDLHDLDITREAALGWLRAAPAVGALFAAVVMAYLPPTKRAGRMLLVCVAGFGLATIGFGLTVNLWMAMAMLALTGAFDNVSMVIRHVVLQMSTPNEMRGRVSSVNAIFIGSSNELGGAESGVVAHYSTPVISVISGGIGTLVVVAAWTGLFPSIWKLGPLSSLRSPTDSTRADEPE